MKNFLAVVAGLAVVIIVSTGLDFVMHRTGVFSRMASPQLGPLWYPALLVVTAIPCTWLGAKLAKPRHG